MNVQIHEVALRLIGRRARTIPQDFLAGDCGSRCLTGVALVILHRYMHSFCCAVQKPFSLFSVLCLSRDVYTCGERPNTSVPRSNYRQLERACYDFAFHQPRGFSTLKFLVHLPMIVIPIINGACARTLFMRPYRCGSIMHVAACDLFTMYSEKARKKMAQLLASKERVRGVRNKTTRFAMPCIIHPLSSTSHQRCSASLTVPPGPNSSLGSTSK